MKAINSQHVVATWPQILLQQVINLLVFGVIRGTRPVFSGILTFEHKSSPQSATKSPVWLILFLKFNMVNFESHTQTLQQRHFVKLMILHDIFIRISEMHKNEERSSSNQHFRLCLLIWVMTWLVVGLSVQWAIFATIAPRWRKTIPATLPLGNHFNKQVSMKKFHEHLINKHKSLLDSQ